ncbi:hypothetical protein C3K47_01375 [Solitalea longa]|uniref:Uncharacterized protein n=1 Tax=Solitalea longa TaxID=2079460 RepID=A0A2S5A9I5_9SPHI|nr:hypothetical protein [Solitalea longa]POY39174.1 hypothetical protein C3K47_01375 [Solitalea longa]
MEMQDQNGKEYFRSLFTTYLSIVVPMSFFIVYALYHPDFLIKKSPYNGSFNVYIAAIFGVIAMYLQLFWYPKRILKAQSLESIIDKLNNYRGAYLMTLLAFQVTAMAFMLSFLFTKNMILEACSIGISIVVLIIYPCKAKVIASLKLSESEIESLDDPEAIVAQVKSSR